MKLLPLLVFLSHLSACQPSSNLIKDYVSSGNNSIYFQSQGSGDAVVLIHDGAADLTMWQPQLDALSESYQVITYDLRGHGLSEFNDNELPDAEDLRAILDRLDIEKTKLVGLSLGAIIALDFSLTYPELVDQLVLMSPGLSGVQEQDTSYLNPIIAMGSALQAGNIEEATNLVEKITFYGAGPRELPDELQSTMNYVRTAFRSYVESGNYTRPPKLNETNPAEKLREIKVPTLLIHGSHDSPYIGNNIKYLEKEIINAKTYLVNAAAHLVNLERPEEINSQLLDFFNQ